MYVSLYMYLQCIYMLCICIYFDVGNWLRIPHVVLSRQNLISFLWDAHSIEQPIPAYHFPIIPLSKNTLPLAVFLFVCLYWTVTHSKLLLLTLNNNNNSNGNNNDNNFLLFLFKGVFTEFSYLCSLVTCLPFDVCFTSVWICVQVKGGVFRYIL